MSRQPQRGEVWQADLGMAAKVRPVVVVSVPYSDGDYALVAVIPHTTSAHGSQFEVSLQVPGLKAGRFNLQGLLAIPTAKFIRALATLSDAQVAELDAALKRWLGLEKTP